jgi:hypothetical protein
MARIVSDPPPPPRTFRPELSPALERVILRGLERERAPRWQSLEEFKQALLALKPRPLPPSGMALRVTAYLIDFLLLGLVSFFLVKALYPLLPGPPEYQAGALMSLVYLALYVGYFTVTECLWGCSAGKAISQLRVCQVDWFDPPRPGQAALRGLVCYGLLHLGLLLAAVAQVFAHAHGGAGGSTVTDLLMIVGLLIWPLLGLFLLVRPLVTRGGDRVLHDLVSGTRVSRRPRPRLAQPLLTTGGWLLSLLHSRSLGQGRAATGALPERIAGFAVRGALKWTADEKLVLGEDAAFGRRVFLWLRPLSAPPLDRARRDVGRPTRLRWLAGGKQGELQWDAILAPSGCPLPDYVQSEGRLPWAEARTVLEDLATELAAACADGTLPRSLSPEQVWLQADGRARLADTALTPGTAAEPAHAATEQERSLELLRRVAVLALEGRPLDPRAPVAVRAPLPESGRVIINRLLGSGGPYENVTEVRDSLADAEE